PTRHVEPVLEADVIDDILLDDGVMRAVTTAIIEMKSIGGVVDRIAAKGQSIPAAVEPVTGTGVADVIDGVVEVLRVSGPAIVDPYRWQVVDGQILHDQMGGLGSSLRFQA